MDAWELADLVRAGDLKAIELLDLTLERIGRYDGELNSFATVDPEGARAEAEAVDQTVASGGDPGPLAGIPIAVKDLEHVKGLPTMRGSLLFKDSMSPEDSTQVSRLRQSGAVVVGKTTTPELGTISFTWSKATGTTRNPWNPERTPGGSSGGSAAAVAAGLVPLATGSDGGGSIRIPSSYSGLPGLKPTYGLVPRGPGRQGTGHTSVYGPIARSVTDIARYLDQAGGAHPLDPFSLPKPAARYEDSLHLTLQGLRATWSSDLGFGLCRSEVTEIARAAAEKLMSAAGIDEVDRPVKLPDTGESWILSESLDCLADMSEFWPARSEEMTPVVSMMIQLAEGLRPSQVAEANAARYELLSAVSRVFEDVDFVLTPTTPTTAFDAEGPMPTEIDGRILTSPLHSVCFTFPFNLTGNPAISIPAGFDSEGLPVGLQVVGPRLSEPLLLSAARLMEEVAPWPKLATNFS
jgi:aspartyl-tRNA(Asn)/glutamyl-tRNA(Gln) amidotransferase subunit A